MSLRLYHSPTSPYVRKVMVLIHEAAFAERVELVPASGTPVDSGTIPVALNPLGKVPLLERPDEPALYDSRVICRYLDDVAGAGLYPAAPRLWDTLTLEATGDGMLDAALLMVYEGRVRPQERRYDRWVESQWAKISRALGTLEDRWLAALAGPLDMGQVAVACALGYLDFRHADRAWRDHHAGLAAWEAGIAARPSLQATRPIGA